MKDLNKKANDPIKHEGENQDNGETGAGGLHPNNPNSSKKEKEMDLPTKVAIGLGVVLVVGVILALIF